MSDPTNRYGVELETRYEFTPWLAADVDVTFTHSQFSTDKENGGGLALAPKQTWAGGLSARHALGPGTARAGLRFYGIGDRPASDDGVIVAPGFTQVDLHLGYRHRRFDVAFDIENLLQRHVPLGAVRHREPPAHRAAHRHALNAPRRVLLRKQRAHRRPSPMATSAGARASTSRPLIRSPRA